MLTRMLAQRFIVACASVVALGVAVFTCALTAQTARAQSYPAKPIRMIVPFPAGGGVDFIGRVVGKHLAERLGQQVLVENRAGANGIVGLEVLKNAAPDGYTIGAASHGPLAVNPSLYPKLPYDTLKDFAPISNMVLFPLMLVVHPSLPVKSVKELIALARARPGELTFSSPGSGNTGHLAGELFNFLAKVQMQHIPFKGTAPANTAVIAGEVQVTFSSIPSVIQFVRAGKLRALGVGQAERIPSMSEFPTIAEAAIPGYEAFAWGGMLAPAGTPRDIVMRLNRDIVAILNQKEVAEVLLKEGTIPVPGTPEEFGNYMRSEIEKWGAIVRKANIRGD
ncbi:MAG: tripartite tricarboxylate transporter substrate binding protein [Proteobacteria bacterium]|nr:tripartite tricarboxylate transporter substrate binding protein [Burkholderiales bacterium]